MSNTVITNYTDLNGPSTKADSSVVVIVNKDGSLSVDQNLLGTLMGTDGSQAAGISVVRVGHEGRPDDATDSESEDDKVPHVTLSVDSYYDEPNSIIKYDSGAEMLQSLRIETRENSLIGFQNDHCYTPFTSPSQTLPQTNENYTTYDEPVIEITHTPPPKPVPSSKKITILEQQIIPKGKKIVINQQESPVILKANDVLNKPLPILPKSKKNDEKKSDSIQKSDDTTESSSISSGDSIPDRDSDSDYKDTKDRSGSLKVKKPKLKPRILKSSKSGKLDAKVATRLKNNKNILKKEVKEKAFNKNVDKKQSNVDVESLIPVSEIPTVTPVVSEHSKTVIKPVQKPVKKEKKTPAHVTALLSDMTSLFSSPDVIRRVSTDNKAPLKPDAKETFTSDKKVSSLLKSQEISNVVKASNNMKSVLHDNIEKSKNSTISPKTYIKQKEKISSDKVTKGFELTATIPQLDEACLAQILQDTSGITSNPVKIQPTISTVNHMNSPGLTGPLSPTLDLLGGLQPEEEGLTEDLLMHVAQLVESSENLQEVIDKQVLGKVDSTQIKSQIQPAYQQTPGNSLYAQTPKSTQKFTTRKDPIEIVRRDGRVITLPPIEAPATRSSKRKIQMESGNTAEVISSPLPIPTQPTAVTPEPQVLAVSKQYTNKKLPSKKQEVAIATSVVDKSAESQESWNSEDDPYRLWCICRQPHNNRFMICCDGCEDWFHGKCVNITKAMGQQMEEQGIEWRCPNCIKKAKGSPKILKASPAQKKIESDTVSTPQLVTKEATSKTNCIVCKKSARASSIYCSDACILKHAQDSLGSPTPNKSEAESGKTSEKQKSDSRVIVYERKSGRLLAGPNAPTAENLKSWLQKNPTFEVVRPGALSTIKPNVPTKKKSLNEPNKIQTTLSFEKIPRKSTEQPTSSKTITSEIKPKTQPQDGKMLKTPPVSKAKLMPEVKMKQSQLPELKIKYQPEKTIKVLQSPKEEKIMPQPKTPISTRANPLQYPDSPKPSTSTPRGVNESRKLIRSANRTPSTYEKAPSVSPSTSRRKDSQDTHRNKMDSSESIRDNVRKALQEQLSQRMAETKSSKFTESEIRQFSIDTEIELHELFRDVGMKYKAKYRSLMFNIKDRKNLSLWQKICERSITPKQLVRLSPEELASQELAQWRDKEVKHQLELIKKSELDMLAASKTYVLKTHKGEEVMETKESVSTELDPNVPVEDLVTALNDSAVGEENKDVNIEELNSKSNKIEKKHGSSRKRTREDSSVTYSKKERRDSKRDTESRKSRSSRRKSEIKEKESKEERSSRRQSRKSSRVKSVSRERSREASKEKTREHSRYRSRSRAKSKRRSKSREHSRSTSHSRDRSHSRSRRRSTSADKSKSKKRSRSKVRSSTEDKQKHRSRSQDNAYNNKNKNDSTDSDSIERPKSAMLKEVHPEYDPHEPMITSAFSEEDLRKSREDVFEDNKIEIGEYGNSDYDASKSFIIDPNIIPSPKYVENQDKSAAEPESDQEPSSTVDNSAAIIWNGCINMVDVARFYVAAHEVSGSASDLEEDLSPELDIVGRINPETVWDYINKMKRAGNKDIVVLRLQAANDEEKMQYIALYSYLSSRNRLGVVKVSNTTSVKDFYIVPLPANTALPSVLSPLDGPGLGEVKTHLLIAIVIRQRKKRMPPHIPKDIIPEKVARLSRKRSYTPPTGAVVSNIAASNIAASNKATYTPPMSPRRRALPLPAYTSPALSTSVKDKIAASLAAADEDEAYSPGSSSSGGSVQTAATQPASNTLRSKMEELNRQIEEQKQQILKMAQADSSAGAEDEAYSPSRPMTPPPVVPLADIALPSNLQEILATIKQRSEPTPDVDMRGLPLPP